jgi:hypothetical protein
MRQAFSGASVMSQDHGGALSGYSIEQARAAFVSGDLVPAQEWLRHVSPDDRPRDLVAALEYRLAKASMGERNWSAAERHLADAVAADQDTFFQLRLGLLRAQRPLMADGAWSTLAETVDEAARLDERSLRPEVTGVWACGAYYSRGRGSGAPWTKLLRMAKGQAEEVPEGAVSLSTGYFCRWLAERTPLLSHVDVVVPIPANPARYGRRMMSLPDELARAAEQQLALPMVFDALRYTAADDLELRGLSRAERRCAVAGSMAIGKSSLIVGRQALLVDDVVTSGATLAEAARMLMLAGASDVFAACLSHTEG